MITEHATVIEGVRAEIRYTPCRGKTPPGRVKPQTWAGDLGSALSEALQKLEEELFETKAAPEYPGLARLKQEKIKAQQREAERKALQRPVHMLCWIDYPQPNTGLLDRDVPGLRLESLGLASSAGMLNHKITELVENASGPIVVLVEGKKNLELAAKMLKLVFEDSLPERVSFISVVASKEEVDATTEFLLLQFSDCPERLIGVVPRGKTRQELCSNVLAALVEAFPPPDLSTSPQS